MPASVHDIQRMLTVCDNVGIQLDMLFNAKRSFLFKIGKIFKVDLEQLQIGNSNVQWSKVPWYKFLFWRTSSTNRPCIIGDGPVGPSLAPEPAEPCY